MPTTRECQRCGACRIEILILESRFINLKYDLQMRFDLCIYIMATQVECPPKKSFEPL